MKLKKILSICLVGAMAATLLTACGSSDETVGEEIKEDAETVVEDVKDVAEEAAEDVKDVAEDIGEGVEAAVDSVGEDVKEAAEEAVDDVKENAKGSFEGFDEMITILARGMTEYGTDGVDEVVDAINEICEPAINVHFEYEVMDVSTYIEQLGLMLAGGEAFDLVMFTPIEASRFSVMQSKSQLYDISDIVYDYAPEMMDLLEDYIDAMEVDGAIYGVPNYRIYNSNYYLIMRKDILDELGLTETAENLSSWDEVNDLFQAVADAQDSLPEELQTACVVGNANTDGSYITLETADLAANNFSDCYTFDLLGDSYRIINVDDGVVTNNFASEDFLTCCERVNEWYSNGWSYKDAQTTVDKGDTLMRNQVCFCYFDMSEVGIESQKEKATGYEVICKEICSGMIQTAAVRNWGWGVPVTSSEPEAACAFLNLMYTDPDIVNLFVYGIEGRDYDINDEGEAVVREDAVYQASDWMYGNQYLCYPSVGQGGDFREVAMDDMLSAEVSPYLGLAVDADPIENELSAVYAVIQKYAPGMESGTTDPVSTQESMVSDMESAGMQTVLDYYQDALDEWLSAQ